LNDIFALQDEISQAIVAALKLKLLPDEKKAIEVRGTDSVEAYKLFLMAREEYRSGFEGDFRRMSTIVRLCQRATEIDPNYAPAWSLMALAQVGMRYGVSDVQEGDGGAVAVERALTLDPKSAEAHAVSARILSETGESEAAFDEIRLALALDPESHEVNKTAARLHFQNGDLEDARQYFHKAVSLFEPDFSSAGMLVTCYTALGDHAAARAAAEITLARVEKVLAQDRNNGTAIGYGADALGILGQAERAKEWMSRALLIDPDNVIMRYSFACCLATHLFDKDAAIEMLVPVFERITLSGVRWAKIDPDFDSLRDDPRFQTMIAEAEARLAAAEQN
jgi:adenylate cyclase